MGSSAVLHVVPFDRARSHAHWDRCRGATLLRCSWMARNGGSPRVGRPNPTPSTGRAAAIGASTTWASPNAAVAPPCTPPTAMASGSMPYSSAWSRSQRTPAAGVVGGVGHRGGHALDVVGGAAEQAGSGPVAHRHRDVAAAGERLGVGLHLPRVAGPEPAARQPHHDRPFLHGVAGGLVHVERRSTAAPEASVVRAVHDVVRDLDVVEHRQPVAVVHRRGVAEGERGGDAAPVVPVAGDHLRIPGAVRQSTAVPSQARNDAATVTWVLKLPSAAGSSQVPTVSSHRVVPVAQTDRSTDDWSRPPKPRAGDRARSPPRPGRSTG